MRVVLLTHYFPPEVGAPQTRLAELAAGLRRHGFEVTVHAPFPHYPDGHVLAPYRLRPLLRERAADGTRIVRSAVYPVANRGFVRRLAGHLSFAASALATAWAAGRADVVVVESPPLFLAAAAVPYAALKRSALVVHLADLWPESAVAVGALSPGPLVDAAERLERWIYAAADRLVVPTTGMAAALADRPAARGKVTRVPPAVELARFAAVSAPANAMPLRVLYAGTVGLAQGLETLVEAARLVGPDTVAVTIAGRGAEWDAVRARIDRDGVGNVRLLGTVAAAAVPELYAGAHAGVILLRDRRLFDGALPTKLFECLAAGRPVVVSARGEAAALVERTQTGIVVAPEDPSALAAAFRTLAADPELRRGAGERARTAATAFDRAGAVERWAELLQGARR